MGDLHPLQITGSCNTSDAVLLANMDAAIARGYPEVSGIEKVRDQPIAIVASGPNVRTQIETIRQLQHSGTVIAAVKDAHDWLIRNGITPNYAVAVDPQPHRWNCFSLKNSETTYAIASQCAPEMFDYLKGHKILLWHLLIRKDQQIPKGKWLLGGGCTSGLRSITLFYVLGYRRFLLFGFDSCLDGDVLRVNGSGLEMNDTIVDVSLDPTGNGKKFYCNAAMALQAEHFQIYYNWMADAVFEPYGEGLIPEIIRERRRQAQEIENVASQTARDDGTVSFIHKWSHHSASYRYRAEIPARHMGASLNDYSAATLIFSKPQLNELLPMAKAKAAGAWIVADFCNEHFAWTQYKEFLRMADVITCPTQALADYIKTLDKTKEDILVSRDAVVIPDPYEFPEAAPHSNGVHLLWFGHQDNRHSLERVLPQLENYPLRVVSNFEGAIPWSHETMLREFRHADIVVLPMIDQFRSANRAVEAVRQGCFVVAEPYPAIMDIPGIWIGDIKEGIEWAHCNSPEARKRTLEAQKFVTAKYSPKTLASAWRSVTRRPTTLAAENDAGLVGSMSI